MITTNIIFDRKKQCKTTGYGTIEIRVTVQRKTNYISTGVRVRDKEWKAGRVVNRPDAPMLNDRLAILYERVCKEVNACINEGRPINTAMLKGEVWQAEEELSDDPLFMDWVEEQMRLLTIAPGTRRHYVTLLHRLVEFDKMRRWQDVTAENIMAFDAWLHQRKKKNGQTIIDAAIYKYHKCLKALINRAVNFGKIDSNPYDRLRGQIKRGEKENIEYLTESEMKAFEFLEVTGDRTMDIAHDLFIFQMYTGLSFGDAQSFDFSKYKWDGVKWSYVGERIKTGVPFVSSLLPPAVHVLEKYDFTIPRIENHVYNRALKALGMMAGITTPLHSHLARHTFATYMLRNGVKIENVSKMLGHTNITQTQRYAKVLAQSVQEDFDMIAKKMKKKKNKPKLLKL